MSRSQRGSLIHDTSHAASRRPLAANRFFTPLLYRQELVDKSADTYHLRIEKRRLVRTTNRPQLQRSFGYGIRLCDKDDPTCGDAPCSSRHVTQHNLTASLFPCHVLLDNRGYTVRSVTTSHPYHRSPCRSSYISPAAVPAPTEFGIPPLDDPSRCIIVDEDGARMRLPVISELRGGQLWPL